MLKNEFFSTKICNLGDTDDEEEEYINVPKHKNKPTKK